MDASVGQLERKWLGHLTQTSNHWANIETSYAILDQLIVPWLLSKKNALDLQADHVAILIVDCWYGWKDQDRKKTLQNFRDYLRQRYPWLKLLFVPAACTDLAQPADRGMISWLKAFMRRVYNDVIAADVLKQLNDGTAAADVKLNVSAPTLKLLLARAFAKALSELPAEKVVHCWAPLAEAYTKMGELHATAGQQLERLFPNKQAPVPDASEEDPPSDVDDDFDTDEGLVARDAEYERVAAAAAAAGVPARRTSRASAAAATAAMDAARERERAPMPTD